MHPSLISYNSKSWTFRDLVIGILVIIALIVVTIYVLYQARFLIIGPRIILTNNPTHLQNERVIELAGTTENISGLWLNGRPIFTDPNGQFRADIVLENGYNITTLQAKDRYGRHTTITREFVYWPMSFSKNP